MMNYASSIKHCELDNVKSRKNNIQTAPALQRELQGAPRVTSHRISHPMPATSGSAVRSLLNHPTSLARRALLLLSVFLLSFGSAWGEEVSLSWSDLYGWNKVEPSLFSGAVKGSVLRIYESENGAIYTGYDDGSWKNIFSDSDNWTPTDEQWNSKKSWGDYTGCVELTLTAEQASILTQKAFIFGRRGNQTIYALTLENPAAPVDDFISDATPGQTEGDSYEITDRSLTEWALDMTTPLTYVASPKYARFQVLKNGTAVDPTSILSITGETPTLCTTKTNGKYVYNASGLGTLTVKLENITAGEFSKYQVVCFLSDDEGTVTSGTLTKEPDPDLQYTYSFTYPVLPVTTHTLSDKVTHSQLGEGTISLNIKEEMRTAFGLTGSDAPTNWYQSWFVEDNAGNRQALVSAWGQTDGTWSFNGGSGSLVDNTCFKGVTNGAAWQFNNDATGGEVTFYTPKGKTLSDYSGYKFVCETSDDYDGTTAVPTHRFYIPIPSPITFEYDGTPTNTDVVQTLDSRTSTTSVTLDWTNTKVTPSITTTGYKYARFYVVDGTGTAVTPTDAAHQLTVTGGTLCTIGESGYYVYDGGSDITLPTVELSSTGDVRDYKVVCWLATTLANINPNDGTIPIVEEPDINVAYTFSFKKPSVASTVDKTANITWNATSMTMDATAGAPDDWDTSWADLSLAQYVKWYVVGADGTTKEPLALGSARQADKWTIGLNSPFSVSDNVAVLTGQTSFTATSWNTWGKPAVYAPSNKAYADVYNYKVICEVSEEASATATPNVRYTFSFTKDFLGSNKSGITTSTQREVLANATDMTCTLSEVTLPAGTKYARFYLLDGGDNIVAPADMLTVTGSKGITVSGYENYGLYVYNESGISTAPTVTLSLTTAELNLYRVVMVTSTDKAVLDGSDNVISEPDYDTRKTWTFKYPTAHAVGTGEVEWSPVSMAVTPTIDALKGAGYLEGLGTNYHIVWTVEDAGTPVELATGTGRQTGKWTISRDGVNATFYAPTGQTYADVQNQKLVARLYETATGEDASDLALTYTVSIIKTEFLGTEKPGCEARQETVEEIEEDATSVTVPLSNALTAFGATAKYARIWLTKDDVVVNPTGKLSLDGLTAFTNSAAQYSYYISNASGITLSDITLTAEPGVKFTQYKVHVALSADEAVGAANYAPVAGPKRTESLTSYEPDYDLLYTFDFSYAAKGKVIHKYVTWDDHMKELDLTSDIDFADLGNEFYIKWYVLDGSGNMQNLAGTNQLSGSSNPTDQWFVYMQNHQQPYPYQLETGGKFLFLASNKDQWGNTLTLGANNEANPMVFTPHDTPLQDLSEYTVVCMVSKTPPTYEGNSVTGEPDETTCTKYVFHFNATGKNPFNGDEKSSIKTAAEAIEIANSSVTSVSAIDLTTNKKVKALTDDGFVPKYVRWQVFDADDNLVSGVLSTGNTTTKVDGLGEYIYSNTGTTDLLKGLSIDVSGQADTDLTHYRIIGLLSDCSADDNLVQNGTKVKEEPDFDLKVTVTFETPFRGRLTANAVEREIIFTQLEVEWDRTVSGQEEFMVSISDDGKTATLQSKSGTTLIEKPLDILADLKTATGNTYTSLNAMENIYVRWYLERKDGSSFVQKGAIRKHNNSSVHFLPSNSTEGANLVHGFYWYKNGTTYSYTGGTPSDAVMAKFVQQGEFLPAAGIDITDYNLVLNVSTHPYSEYAASYLNADHTINHEPDDLDIRYVFNFQNKGFPSENLDDPNLKVIYKNALYNSSTGEVSPVLFSDTGKGFLIDAGCTENQIKTKGYARWYIAEKATGNIVSGIGTDFTFDNAYSLYNLQTPYGWYSSPINRNGSIIEFDGKFTLPENLRANYHDYVVVCLLSKDIDNGGSYTAESYRNKVTVEPLMDVKYVYNLILTEDEYAALPFVHYKGESGRDWIVPEGSTGSQAQKVWNTSTGEAEDFTGDIRQGVHTWEYEVYIKPGETRTLMLPFQFYDSSGQALEPRAYFRWYDWKTDKAVVDANFTFTKDADASNLLKNIDGRGLFALLIGDRLSGVNATQKTVGVTFTPDVSFSESIDIACDVSKYSDGIVTIGEQTYMVHEPTLSNRYIFHIHPAEESVNKLQASKNTLEAAEAIIKGGTTNTQMHDYFVAQESDMFKLAEDKGKVVVSLGAGKIGMFALRFDEHRIVNYIMKDGDNYVSADKFKWYAYFENDQGIWRKKINNDDNDSRIADFEYSNFIGDYNNLKGEETVKITDGKKFHVVGYAGVGSSFNPVTGTGIYAPVVHYELHFIEAPPIPVSELSESANLSRTDEYLRYHYNLAGVVDFDGNPETNPNLSGHESEYYSTANWFDAPTSSADNITYTPFPWEDIQYGFCYPNLTATIKNGMDTGVSPEHGDYIIVKSMNATGISSDMNTEPYNFHWWNGTELYDYTHTVTDNSKYGSFLYTDASDESRTIATIPFTADLCHGSSIYFTAAVSNKTDAAVKPQLLIRIVGIDREGNRERVVAFHTCDIQTAGATTGVWNQVYGVSTIPTDFNDNITNFVAEVINYANGTLGADFAIDQLVIYTSTSKVQLKQTGSTCEDPTEGKLKVYMDAEGLQNSYGKTDTEQTIYWRICREDDGTVVKASGMYPQYDTDGNLIPDDGSFTYGVSKVKPNFNPTSDVKSEADRENDAYGWYLSADNIIYFQIANKNFPGLEEGGRYYVSIYDPNESFDNSKESYWGGLDWGATSKCSIFSNFFIPQRQYVTYDSDSGGAEGGNLYVSCGGSSSISDVQMVLKVPDVNEPTGFKTLKNLHYDFIFVPLSTWTSATATFTHSGTNYTYEDLRTAVADYRGVSSAYNTVVGLASAYSSSSHYGILQAAIAEGILDLAYSETITHTFTGESTVTCLPVEKQVTISEGVKEVCSPFEVTFRLLGSSPELALGFSDVNYPVSGYEKRVVRIGLEQLDNLRNHGYKLHIPVNKYKDKDKKTDNTLSFTHEYLTLSAASTDGVNTATGVNFAKIVNHDDPSQAPYVDGDHMYLELDLSGSNCAINFHEGFEYEVSTSYYDTRDAGESGRCEGDIYLLIKVVPEFVTWNPQQIEGDFYNVNWNNDANWKRSTRVELYKDVKGSAQNTPTSGHPSGYDNNGEGDLTSITDTPSTYVPMRFSYVTLPENCRAPSLTNMEIKAWAHEQEDYTGGTLQAGNLGTDRSPNDGGTSYATTNIRYDMLVRYSFNSSDNQDRCQGHLKADGVTVVGQHDANIYDCEKYYGNTCREIYFKPGAEIINQQRLVDYQKAWVEKEVDRNKWYLLSAPLKGTYAGDMFVPTAMTDYSLATPVSVRGRQVSEVFQPITFPDDANATYSRTNYPVYQRSWDHSQDGGKVYTETTDPRASYYSANINYSGAVTSTFAQWTHVYNDVQVRYDELQGFSLRAHKKDGATGEKALFRWPKWNESYTYYDYKDTKGSVTQTTAKSEDIYARFITDGLDNKATMTTVLNTARDLDEANVNTDNQYYLVGNPYMSSLDMQKFFELNPSLTGAYWKLDGDPSVGLQTGQVKPMESFFVKTTNPDMEIQFNNSVMIDGNAPLLTPAPAPALSPMLTLSAGGSEAKVYLSEEASAGYEETEDVETLFDSNLADVPMVYTVAGGQAVSIDARPELDVVPFGVTCSSDEPVNVNVTVGQRSEVEGQRSEVEGQISNLNSQISNLYVYDALTGESTEVGEDGTVTIQPNDYGRYYLTSSIAPSPWERAGGEALISVRGSQVTVTATDNLQQVRAVNISGATMYQAADCGTTCQFQLQPGTYVIEADSAAGRKTVKVFVR